MAKGELTHHIEIELGSDGGGWTEVSSDVLFEPNIDVMYGISQPSRTSRIGRIGRLKFQLDNSPSNSAGKRGYYTPEHTNARGGFEVGKHARWTVERAPRDTDADVAVGQGVTLTTDGWATFDGSTNADIDFTAQSTTDIDKLFTSDGTLSMWFAPATTDIWMYGTDYRMPVYLASTNAVDADDYLSVQFGRANDKIRVVWGSDIGFDKYTATDVGGTTDDFHFALTWTTDTLKFWAQGDQSGDDQTIEQWRGGITAFQLGRDFGTFPWLGKEAHFALWDHELDSDEIKELHDNYNDQETTVRTLIPASDGRLLRYYPLDEKSGAGGQIVEDHSTDIWYKFHGTIDCIEPEPGEYHSQITRVTVADWMKDASEEKIASIPAQVGKTIDDVMRGYFSDIETVPNAQDFAVGTANFSYAGQAGGSRTALLSEMRKLANSEPSYIYMRGSKNTEGLDGGVLAVENKDTRNIKSVEATVQNWMISMQADRRRSEIYNDVRATVHPSVVDTNIVTIYEFADEISVAPKTETTFSGRYRDSDDPSAQVGAYSITALNDTDFTLRTGTDANEAYNSPLTKRISFTSDLIAFYALTTDGGVYDAVSVLGNRDGSWVGNPVSGSQSIDGTDDLMDIHYVTQDANDYAEINTTDLYQHDFRSGTLVLYMKPTDNASDTGDQMEEISWLRTNNDSDGKYYDIRALRIIASNEDLIDNGLYYNATDELAYIATDITMNYDNSIKGGFTQYAMTWKFEDRTTDMGYVKNFINGTDIAEVPIDSNAKMPSTDVFINKILIGMYSTSVGVFGLAGEISHYALYDTDLTSDEINTMYVYDSADAVEISAEYGGTSPQFTLDNKTYLEFYLSSITDMQGKLLQDLNPITVKITDSDSIDNYGLSVYELDMPYQDDQSKARSAATDFLAKTKDPQMQVPTVSFIANYDTDTRDYFLGVEPGDRIALAEPQTGLATSDEFIVQGVRYNVTSPDIVYVNWMVYPD